jgi:hypothetical protein
MMKLISAPSGLWPADGRLRPATTSRAYDGARIAARTIATGLAWPLRTAPTPSRSTTSPAAA